MENNLLCFKRTSNLTALSLPKIYRESFYTKEGVWTKLIIIKGKMKLSFLDDENSVIKQLTLNKKNILELNVLKASQNNNSSLEVINN